MPTHTPSERRKNRRFGAGVLGQPSRNTGSPTDQALRDTAGKSRTGRKSLLTLPKKKATVAKELKNKRRS